MKFYMEFWRLSKEWKWLSPWPCHILEETKLCLQEAEM